MPELQQPDIVGNFLSSYGTAQAQQQAQKDRAFQQQRVMRQDDMAEQQFGMQKQKHQFEIAQQVVDMLGSVQDGDEMGFERAKQRWGQMGLPMEAVAGFTVADLPSLRVKAGTQLRELQAQAQQANIRQSDAAASQSRASARAADALAQYRTSGGVGGTPGRTGRPIPAGVQAKEDDDIETIGAARTLQAKTSDWITAFTKGGLETGPGSQAMRVFNEATGVGTSNSRTLSLFQNDLEGMRNDSLRLNKGVQTEGDAVREWRNLMSNVMDQEYVVKALGRINAINKRAEALKIRQINIRRDRNGLPPLDPQEISLGVPDTLGYADPGVDGQGGGDDFSDVDALLGLK